MKLYLAPMEGLVDWIVRDTLTGIGGIDVCTTEFIRVTDRLVPDHVIIDYCPELKTGTKTRSGTPVLVQLLGGQPIPLAETAKRAVELGAVGIDLNFGCPAKTVNRHDGGATLLKFPNRVFNILETVRRSVSPIPVSAKIRLGYDDPSMCLDVAWAVEQSGIKTLTVHCRTKVDMYKPPAHWDWIPKIRERAPGLNIIANGEVWTVHDYWRCREITGCEDVMIGRGAIADPFLFLKIKASQRVMFEAAQQAMNLRRESASTADATSLSIASADGFGWGQVKGLMLPFYRTCLQAKSEKFARARTKQWLAQIAKREHEAKIFFDEVKALDTAAEFEGRIAAL